MAYKHVVITGANAGIGYATAADLLGQGAHVTIACRNPQKAAQAIDSLNNHCTLEGQKLRSVSLDLASFARIREAAAEVTALEPIDVLINNAGAVPNNLEHTEEGFEWQFGTMHLGHFLWTHLLLHRLRAAPAPRVVNVSSMMHQFGKIREKTFHDRRPYNPLGAYAQAKLCNVLFASEAAKRWAGDGANPGIVSVSLHPGGVGSEIYRNTPAPIEWLIKKTSLTVEEGARTSIFCASDGSIPRYNGGYFAKSAPAKPSRKAQDPKMAAWLWDESIALTGLQAQ